MGPLDAAWGRYIRKAPNRLAEDSGNKTEDGEVSIWKFPFSITEGSVTEEEFLIYSYTNTNQ